ncbi:MAG: STAS domain-containing protein [Rikenellaceae bacterium]
MEIQITKQEEKIEVKVIGRIDTVTAAQFEQETAELLSVPAAQISLNCEELSYVSSSGLRSLLKLLKSVTAIGGSLTLCGLKAEIKEVFDITGFSSLFTIL